MMCNDLMLLSRAFLLIDPLGLGLSSGIVSFTSFLQGLFGVLGGSEKTEFKYSSATGQHKVLDIS